MNSEILEFIVANDYYQMFKDTFVKDDVKIQENGNFVNVHFKVNDKWKYTGQVRTKKELIDLINNKP